MEWLEKLFVDHRPVARIVPVPTLSVIEIGPGERRIKRVAVQWFGETLGARKLPEERQYYLPLIGELADRDAFQWFGLLERFKVVFMGQVKDWPAGEDARKEIAEGLAVNGENGWVVWVVCGLLGLKYHNDVGPASYAAPFVLLGDPNYGVIRPRAYCDLSVLEMERMLLK